MYFWILLLWCQKCATSGTFLSKALTTHGHETNLTNAPGTSYYTVEWKLHQFLKDNGIKYVTIMENCTNVCMQQQKIAFIVAKAMSIYARTSTMDNYMEQYNFKYLDMQIFIFNPWNDDLGKFLYALTKAPVESILIFCRADWTPSVEMVVRSRLKEFAHDSMFYLVISSSSGISWNQVITLKSGYSLKEIRFFPGSLKIVKDYDLNGLIIYSISDSWAPFLTYKDCNKDGTVCNTYGYLKDYADMIATQFNFSYESHRQMDGDWGTLPKSGPNNITGEWGGMLGSVITRKYDLCLSQWAWYIDRYGLLSFVSFRNGKTVLALTPKKPETDFGLFTRPFTHDSWVAIWLATFIMIVFIIGAHYFKPDTHGNKIMVTTLWYFFLLLNVYYGGALTMFFTSEITIPFNSITDVMQAHPDWKLVFLDGEEATIALNVERDPDYADYWARVQTNPDEYMFKSMKEGLDMIAKSETVMQTDYDKISGYFKANPFYVQRINIFATVDQSANTLVFPHNSPLKSIFTKGVTRIQENGLQERNWLNISCNISQGLH
jgi:hypothetical protein